MRFLIGGSWVRVLHEAKYCKLFTGVTLRKKTNPETFYLEQAWATVHIRPAKHLNVALELHLKLKKAILTMKTH